MGLTSCRSITIPEMIAHRRRGAQSASSRLPCRCRTRRRRYTLIRNGPANGMVRSSVPPWPHTARCMARCSPARETDSGGRRNHAYFVILGVGDEDRAISGYRHSCGRMELGTGGQAVIPAVTGGPRPRDPGNHARRRHLPHHIVLKFDDQEPAIRGHRHPQGHLELGVGSRAVIPAATRDPVPATREMMPIAFPFTMSAARSRHHIGHVIFWARQHQVPACSVAMQRMTAQRA